MTTTRPRRPPLIFPPRIISQIYFAAFGESGIVIPDQTRSKGIYAMELGKKPLAEGTHVLFGYKDGVTFGEGVICGVFNNGTPVLGLG